jgi:hypothetical protein
MIKIYVVYVQPSAEKSFLGGVGSVLNNLEGPDPSVVYPHHLDADPDSDFYLMRIRVWIRLLSLMRIRIQILAYK